jgi:alkylhydroperoxidase family enzyme
MPRLRQVSRSEASPEIQEVYSRLFQDRDPVAQPGTRTGTPGNWWTVYALVPDILNHARTGFDVFHSKARILTDYERELALVRTGFVGESQFVFSQHCKGARAAGIPAEKVDAIPSWSASELFDAKERAILAYVDGVVTGVGRVPDGTFAAIKQYLSDEAILELTYVVATYRLHTIMCRALRLEYDDVPERIVEIPVPEGEAASVNIMADIGTGRS